MATQAFALGSIVMDEQENVSAPSLSVGAPAVSARHRVDLAGVRIDRVSTATAVEHIRRFIRSGQAHQIVTVNLDFLTIARQSEQFRDVLNSADLAVADGMPLVWASRLKGQGLAERIAGVELVDESCALAVEMNQAVYLLGAEPSVARAAAVRLTQRFRGLNIAGVYSPPFGPLSDAENQKIISSIRATRPAILFVAFGAPRQDLWIRQHLSELGVPVVMGVGCVFDLLAGRINRAPSWMRHSGLEWAFRLGQEPGRLWQRYARDVPTLAHLLLESFDGSNPSSASTTRSSN